MKKIIRLTESDLTRIVRNVIKEQNENMQEKTLGNGVLLSMDFPKKEFKQYKVEFTSDEDKKIMQVLKYIKSRGGKEVGPTATSMRRDKSSDKKIVSRTTTIELPSDFDFDFKGL